MKDNFVITTTGSIEGATIKQYIDVVCNNVVVGTNIFSDFAASLTDFFGGKSNSYRKKLEYIYAEAVKDLKRKSLNLGANAIIGLRVDFDEISGKDKSMFMVSVSGTACKIEYNSTLEEESNRSIVKLADLENEIMRRTIIEQLNGGEDLNDEWIQYLIENPQTEVLEALIKLYVKYSSDKTAGNPDIIENIIQVYPKNISLPILYKLFTEQDDDKLILSLLDRCKLFSPLDVLEICKKDIHKGIKLLSLKSDCYDKQDISIMNMILDAIDNLPDTGRVEKAKTGIFSKKEEEVFICQNNHKNSLDNEFSDSCWLNIKGLHRYEVNTIKDFKKRVEILNEMV